MDAANYWLGDSISREVIVTLAADDWVSIQVSRGGGAGVVGWVDTGISAGTAISAIITIQKIGEA
ncbi:MAG: hypothetical protein AABY84_08805 [Candidatus Firestonebacteria bacterium]